MSGITYYKTQSPYRGDITKRTSLNGQEIDNNFLTLEGRDIESINVNGHNLITKLRNGDSFTTRLPNTSGGGDGFNTIYLPNGSSIDVTVRIPHVIGYFNATISGEIYASSMKVSSITWAEGSFNIENLSLTPTDELANVFNLSFTYENVDYVFDVYYNGLYGNSSYITYHNEGLIAGDVSFNVINGSYDHTLLNLDSDNKVVINEHSLTDLDCDLIMYEIMKINNIDTGIPYTIVFSSRALDIIEFKEIYVLLYTNTDIFTIFINNSNANNNDLMLSVSWADLSNRVRNSQLIPGMKYRINNYTCTTIQSDTQAANHYFDIIVTADSNAKLNENAKAVYRGDNNYFLNSNLDAWEIKYCLANDTERFAWADPINGKGVIYYMKDEWGNEAPYDFKNIKFNVDGYYLYTFNWFSGGVNPTIDDLSVNQFKYPTSDNVTDIEYKHTFNNVIKPYINNNSKQELNRIVFGNYQQSDNTFQGCYGNIFGANCHDIKFYTTAISNKFGDDCYSNSFEGVCINNRFGNTNNNINVKFGVTKCEFGENNSYINNTLSKSSIECIRFGNDCCLISLGDAKDGDGKIRYYTFKDGIQVGNNAILELPFDGSDGVARNVATYASGNRLWAYWLDGTIGSIRVEEVILN